ncbi:MAG: ATP-dependent DNA helicase RecG [Candidatus Neomarinimicrobiota bacterium]|nr:ATP-dependent DNA helicase RecG [Candidatus Neomarinimicrobiota bacterium]
MPTFDLDSHLSILSGVGSHRAEIFSDHHVVSVRDLLYYFPRRHLDRTTVTQIRNLIRGESCSIIGQVETLGVKPTRRGKIFQAIISDGTGLLMLTWFNGIRYVKRLFKMGDRLAVHGKVEWYKGFSMLHPEFDKLDENDDPLSTGSVIPLYPLTNELRSAGIEQRVLRKIVRDVLNSIEHIPDIFTNAFIKEYNLVSLHDALQQIHFAENIDQLKTAVQRLKFDEHFFLQLLMALRKISLKQTATRPLPDIGPYFRTIADSLPFDLTKAQKKVLKEIHEDMKKTTAMNRLLQGDVGSGKTIVAILSCVLAVGNNVQVAIMAPTEILANQHYRSITAELNRTKIPSSFLIGNMKKSERQSILNGLKNGKIPIVIGTHALIQDDVEFKNLGLVIVDEQHRFGVLQRGKLLDKGYNPHFMAMTATPIPRTLAITYMGDMELSIIDEMPANRIPVVTKVVEPIRLPKVFAFIRDEIKSGRQCMVIYPLVEESEKTDMAAAVEAHQKLNKKEFSDLNVGLVHGRMKTNEKNSIMKKFESNEINILVSTTVVEVGVDIPNATVMMVEHAERFGLTQLHQLRGRVGRGSDKSYCILVHRNETDNSRLRLAIMEKTNDGFQIADEDLKLRGPGDYFGMQQSGFIQYKIANMITDGSIIRQARQAAFNLVEKDPDLRHDQHAGIRKQFLLDYKDKLDMVKIS